jgi:hypothetical protein
MQFLPNPNTVHYPDCEKSKLEELENLFRDWHQHFAEHVSELDKHQQGADDMVFDGFYPYYFSQKKKRILFIGWETLQMAEYGKNNYIEELYRCYTKERRIGNRRLNSHMFHYRMICIAYGILHEMPDWHNFGEAETLIEDFANSDGWSFAFMNISKLSNDSGKSAANWNLINTSIRLSTKGGRNFIEEEIAVLEPHIVIAMNPKEKYDAHSLGEVSVWVPESAGVNSCWLESCGHRSLLIDSWHFSARDTKDPTHYYVPICDAIRRSEAVAAIGQTVTNQI